MSARPKNEGRTYLRRSTSKQETGIFEQLNWAIAEAKRLDVRLDAAPTDLDHMLARGLVEYKGLFLDDGITGSDLNRPGFVACRRAVLADRRVSHMFIHISDRFARPELAVQAMQMEIDLLLAGLTIIFSNRTSEPRDRRQYYFERDILLLHEYTQNGEFLNKLAVRVLHTQARLARESYRTGGRAPYGFLRVLVDGQSNEIQELPAGTTARREGCHVIVKPHDPVKVSTWLSILHMYGEKHWGLLRICNHLNDLGIPSPGAGLLRRKDGRRVPVSGQWNMRTVARLIDDADVVGLSEYGRRSSGTHRRFDPEGPRTLAATDRDEDGEAKPVYLPKEQRITAPARHAGCATPELFETCQALREKRAHNRRGIRRASDPGLYPLSSRVYDLTAKCGAVLYGRKERQRPVYVCSKYMRSAGRKCFHNTVDGEATLAFVLDVLRQPVQMCGGREALRRRLEQLAAAPSTAPVHPLADELRLAEQRLAEVEGELRTIQRSLALAANPKTLAAIEAVYTEKDAEAGRLREQVAGLQARSAQAPASTPEEEVKSALQLFDEIERVTSDPAARAAIPQLLRKINLNLWLNFGEAQRGKKPTRVVASGILTTGHGPKPGVPVQVDGVPPPNAGGSGGDAESPPVGSEQMPAVCDEKRHQENGGFTIGNLGEPGA